MASALYNSHFTEIDGFAKVHTSSCHQLLSLNKWTHSPWHCQEQSISSRCRTFIDAVMWSVWKIWTSLKLQNSFLYPSHPFSSSFSGNILVASVNCRNQFIGSTITVNLWMFRCKFSLWSDYLSKNCYKFNYCRCFLNVSLHEDYNTWNFASL